MALIIVVILAWTLTKIMKWEHTSGYCVFLITLAALCEESRLFLVPFLIIVHFQTKMIREEFKRSGCTDLRLFLKQREINHA